MANNLKILKKKMKNNRLKCKLKSLIPKKTLKIIKSQKIMKINRKKVKSRDKKIINKM